MNTYSIKSRKKLFSRMISFTITTTMVLAMFIPTASKVYADDMRLYQQYDKSPKLSYVTDWLGNSFSGVPKHVQSWINNACVTPDGTVLTTAGWDEGLEEVSAYKNGDKLGALLATHGNVDGNAVATNGKYVWATSGNMLKVGLVSTMACKTVITLPTNAVSTGLAANDTSLYVSDSANNLIRVLDAETGIEKSNFAVTKPGKLTLDNDGNLWVMQLPDANGKTKVLKYSSAGVIATNSAITFGENVQPTSIGFNKVKNQLMITDNGIEQNIKLYDVAAIKGTPTDIKGTFGTKYGIFSGTPGLNAPLKFHDLVGCGADKDGNIYVAFGIGPDKAGSEIQAYTPEGSKKLWSVYGAGGFVNAASPDLSSDESFYTTNQHYIKDYTLGSGLGWTYKGYTLNQFKYPDDPRLHSSYVSPFIRIIKGKKYMFATGQYSESLAIFRFNETTDGEVAIPCGFISKEGNFTESEPNTDYFSINGTKYEAENANSKSDSLGVGDDLNASNGKYIGWANHGKYMEFDSVDFGQAGATSVTAQVASENGNGTIEVRLDSLEGTLLGTITCPNTGNWGTWKEVTADITQTSGTHKVFFVYKQKITGKEYPSANVGPAQGEFMWNDSNGDGKIDKAEIITNTSAAAIGKDAPELWDWDVDSDGNIWQACQGTAGIREFKLKGVSKKGALEYGYDNKSMDVTVMPKLLTSDGKSVDANGKAEKWNDFERSHYVPKTDTMYLSGYADDNSNNENDWGQIGRVIVRYDNWSKKSRTQVWRVDLEDKPYTNLCKSWDFAGDYMFLGYCKDGRIQAYKNSDGSLVGHMYAGPEVGKISGWLDTPYAISARKLSNGSYVITAEEDLYNKQLVYEWDGKSLDPAGDEPLPPFPADKPIYKATQSINVDAKFTESDWNDRINIPVMKITGGQNENITNFGVLYDDNYLYLAETVKDSSLYKSSTAQWENDAAEFYIDGDNDKLGSYNEHDLQLIFGYSFNQDELFTSGNLTADQKSQIKRVWAPTADGYNVEIAVPWSLLGVTPKSGAKIGIDAANDDNADGSGRGGGTIAYGDGGEFMNNINFLNFVFTSAGVVPLAGETPVLTPPVVAPVVIPSVAK